MGAQLSTWSISPAWKRWLEERCSLELLRSIYKDFRVVLLSRNGNEDNDPFFISAEDFRQVQIEADRLLYQRSFVMPTRTFDAILHTCTYCITRGLPRETHEILYGH